MFLREARAIPDLDLGAGPVDLVVNSNLDVVAPTPFAWLPARLWSCPGCASTVLTWEAAPRCRLCGFREET
jgi:hypothetical protein